MQSERERIVKRFEMLSDKFHKMSLLFYELSRSLNIELKPIEHSRKQIKEHLKKLDLDYDKIIQLTTIKSISLEDLKKDEQ